MKKHPILSGCAVLIGIFIAFSVFAAIFGGSGGSSYFGDSVAIVEVAGVITDSADVLKQLEEYENDETVKAVVIRINSPGGEVAPSQEIYETVKKLDEKKPVIASMGSVAASGGYYIALGARKIVANPGTVTGSIGVILEIANFEEVMNWAKIRHEIIKTGPYKDIGSPLRQMTPDERTKLQAFADNVFDQFVTAVEKQRKIPREQVLEIATGMVYTGSQAKDMNLIDNLGTINDAIDIAAREGKIEGEPNVIHPKAPSPLEKFIGGKFGGVREFLPREGVRVLFLCRL